MIPFDELLELCKAEAFADKFEPTQQSVWENICRQYSKSFFTPLHEVLKMDPEYVMRQVFSHQLDDVDVTEHLETLDDSLHELEDPNWSADAEKDLAKFLKEAEEEEAERLKNGTSLKTIMRKGYNPRMLPKKPEPKAEAKPVEPEQPKGGSVDLSSIANDENER